MPYNEKKKDKTKQRKFQMRESLSGLEPETFSTSRRRDNRYTIVTHPTLKNYKIQRVLYFQSSIYYSTCTILYVSRYISILHSSHYAHLLHRSNPICSSKYPKNDDTTIFTYTMGTFTYLHFRPLVLFEGNS